MRTQDTYTQKTETHAPILALAAAASFSPLAPAAAPPLPPPPPGFLKKLRMSISLSLSLSLSLAVHASFSRQAEGDGRSLCVCGWVGRVCVWVRCDAGEGSLSRCSMPWPADKRAPHASPPRSKPGRACLPSQGHTNKHPAPSQAHAYKKNKSSQAGPRTSPTRVGEGPSLLARTTREGGPRGGKTCLPAFSGQTDNPAPASSLDLVGVSHSERSGMQRANTCQAAFALGWNLHVAM